MSDLTETFDEVEGLVDDLWELSTEFYAQIAVKNQLLNLQKSQGININLMLFGLWVSQVYRINFTPEVISNIIKDASRSQNWAKRIRQLRFEIEQQWEAPYSMAVGQVRSTLLKSELKIEQIHQRNLVKALQHYQPFVERPLVAAEIKTLTLSNITAFCGEATNPLEYQWLVDTWHAFLEKRQSSRFTQ